MDYNDIYLQQIKSGTKVYACAYEYNTSKEGRFLHQTPILGVLSYTNKAYFKDTIDDLNQNCKYFIPYKKNAKSLSYDNLAFSQAVSIYSRFFFYNMEECKDKYNSLINENIQWHLKQIERLKNDLL